MKANESVRSLLKAASLIAQRTEQISEDSMVIIDCPLLYCSFELYVSIIKNRMQNIMDGILMLAEKDSIEASSSVADLETKKSGEENEKQPDNNKEPKVQLSQPSKKLSSSSTLVMLLLKSYSCFPLLRSLNNAPLTINKCFGHLVKTGQFASAIT